MFVYIYWSVRTRSPTLPRTSVSVVPGVFITPATRSAPSGPLSSGWTSRWAVLDGTQWTIDKREGIEDRMRVEDDQPATKSNLSDVKKFASIEHDACVASLRTYLAQDNLAYIIRDTNPPSTFAVWWRSGSAIDHSCRLVEHFSGRVQVIGLCLPYLI